MDLTFDQTKRFSPLEVYQTAIQLMYETVQRNWDEPVQLMVAEFEGYDIMMMLINAQSAGMPDQLKVGHCVAALYRAIATMTDGVLFCQLRSNLSIFEKRVGALSITPISSGRPALAAAAAAAPGTNSSLTKMVTTTTSDVETTNDVQGFASGMVTDPDYPHLSVKYHFLGKLIKSKEISMVVIEAMTAMAPFATEAECKEMMVTTRDGGASLIIESTNSARFKFTYRWAVRVLKILYQRVIVRLKTWGDVWLEIEYEGVKFGELRMLRGAGVKGAVAKRGDFDQVF
ncbi:MAG: hypothetical protein Q9168_007971 [Polycauliona sp. 1 TL-2023]